MKKYIINISMAMAVFAFIAMLPFTASAASQAIHVTMREDRDSASVKLILPKASQEGITTVSISLAIDLEGVAGETEELQSVVDFTGWIAGNTKVHTYRSQGGVDLNIYIAGTTPLFTAAEGGDILDIGNVYVTNAVDGSRVPFAIDLERSALKVVRGNTEALVTEEDFFGYGSGTDDPSGDEPNKPNDKPGMTPETESLRAELQALIERAEMIPAEDRTEELQRAIDEAKRVLDDPNSSLEELKTALMNLENALALFESNQNSENNTADTGKDTSEQNRKQNGVRIQSVKTGDTNQALLYLVVMVLGMAVLVRRFRIHR